MQPAKSIDAGNDLVVNNQQKQFFDHKLVWDKLKIN